MRGLFGSHSKCLDAIDRVEAADVDEVACPIDYGVPRADVMASLDHLDVVRILANPKKTAVAR